MATKKELVDALEAHIEKLESKRDEALELAQSPKHSDFADKPGNEKLVEALKAEISALKKLVKND